MSAGVYLLSHAGRRLVYVGGSADLEHREAQHRFALGMAFYKDNYLLRYHKSFVRTPRSRARLPSLTFQWAARGTLPCEWRFTVLEEVSELGELDDRESFYIVRAKALLGKGCLNVYARSPVRQRKWSEPVARAG